LRPYGLVLLLFLLISPLLALDIAPETSRLNTTVLRISVATTPAPTAYTPEDVLLDSDSILIFKRSSYYNGDVYRNFGQKSEVFGINSSMNGTLSFKCSANVRNPHMSTDNITFDTYWIDGNTLEIVSNTSILEFENVWRYVADGKSWKYRCAARLTIPSRQIKGVIHSKSIVLKSVNEPILQVLPPK
jgi:hypothetical protein